MILGQLKLGEHQVKCRALVKESGRTGGLQILRGEIGLAQALCLVFCFFRLFLIPPRQRGWFGEVVIEYDDGGD